MQRSSYAALLAAVVLRTPEGRECCEALNSIKDPVVPPSEGGACGGGRLMMVQSFCTYDLPDCCLFLRFRFGNKEYDHKDQSGFNNITSIVRSHYGFDLGFEVSLQDLCSYPRKQYLVFPNAGPPYVLVGWLSRMSFL